MAKADIDFLGISTVRVGAFGLNFDRDLAGREIDAIVSYDLLLAPNSKGADPSPQGRVNGSATVENGTIVTGSIGPFPYLNAFYVLWIVITTVPTATQVAETLDLWTYLGPIQNPPGAPPPSP